MEVSAMAEEVCPWWFGYVLVNPLRRLLQNPEKLLAPHVKPGMTAMDVGCAMGFFSLPLAELVGGEGRVVCVDLQERMLRSLRKRAARAGLEDRIEMRACSSESLGTGDLEGAVDFALAFAVVHEVPEQARLLAEIHGALRAGGRFLLAEPAGHVPEKSFAESIAAAEAAGLAVVDRPRIRMSHAALLERKA
jgi:ubiquinone/menaquinone biosynthesis C-methylase UbiE